MHILVYGKLSNFLLVIFMVNELKGEFRDSAQFKSVNILVVTNSQPIAVVKTLIILLTN